ncbi:MULTISPECIES: hypothetical protein [Vibrio]|uniref:Uncharacterized protein n=1 Tax=Vibrio proteolyticus NBRC 13287 TaxID=1219065 RepID=U3BHV0_VIBPR|nr:MULTISPECIES: hypothetical protein [Vibrio]NAW57053.1 hypothetical protein [Vibrio sp. V36_P2S2PM302]NAX22202.1 hypothetical protein [Vibrio sp. V39_P1S14PM300]NAX26418.1 hypothetical protein [Vibrio sp. V38_P2S17PM301]NAX32891.1 hypothetical protein [Vibrio sp. V37_P2S8PM304]GAD66238.1 hypothetical protein VPR01S_03_01470 [Vibrio proteolyticus NBRC 13287]
MYQHSGDAPKKDGLQKALLWLIVIDYCLLTLFLSQLANLTLRAGTGISTLLVLYNVLLSSLCFQRTSKRDSYIIYPTLSATLLAFTFFLYFFFLI